VTLRVLWPTMYVCVFLRVCMYARIYICMYVAPVLQYYYKYRYFRSQIYV